MIIGIKYKSTIIPREMSTQINTRVTRSMTQFATQQQQVRSQSQLDPTTGVEFLTYEHCKKRGLSNIIYRNDGIMVNACVYLKINMVHPMYLENLSPEQLSNQDLLAVAPHGFLWKEGRSTTSYYHWDEYHRLVKNPYM